MSEQTELTLIENIGDNGDETTSDSCTVRPVPRDLLPYVKSRVLHYVNEAKDLSAEIQQTSETEARLVFNHGAKFAEKQEAVSNVDDNSETVTGNTILVKNVPQSVDEEILELFFESGKKVGAGPVKSVKLNRQKNWAIIEFCEQRAVEVVMKKKPVILLDTTLDIHLYAPLLCGDESINSLEIRGLPSELTQDILSVQTEGLPDSYASSHIEEAVGADDPERSVAIEEETVSSLKPVQLRMLSLTKFPITEEQKCPNMKVDIDHSKNEIVFKGERADILNIKLNMFESLNKFSIRVLNIPESHMELFRAAKVQRYIVKTLETKKLVCTWEVRGSELVICSSEADIASCVNIVRKSVKEEIIAASGDSVGTLYSCQWPARLRDLHKESKFIFKVDSDYSFKKIHVISTDDVSSEVAKIIKEFLRSKADIQKECLKADSPVVPRLFEANKHCTNAIHNSVKEIESELSVHYVSIQIAERETPGYYRDCVDLQGTLEGIARAKTKLSSL